MNNEWADALTQTSVLPCDGYIPLRGFLTNICLQCEDKQFLLFLLLKMSNKCFLSSSNNLKGSVEKLQTENMNQTRFHWWFEVNKLGCVTSRWRFGLSCWWSQFSRRSSRLNRKQTGRRKIRGRGRSGRREREKVPCVRLLSWWCHLMVIYPLDLLLGQ